MGFLLEDAKEFIIGAFSLLFPSTWRWMREAVDEYSPDMTYSDMIGVVLFNERRRRIHEENDPYRDY